VTCARLYKARVRTAITLSNHFSDSVLQIFDLTKNGSQHRTPAA
jgi:hypothetical protein